MLGFAFRSCSETLLYLPNMNLVLYTGLLGGYLDPQGIEEVPLKIALLKGLYKFLIALRLTVST